MVHIEPPLDLPVPDIDILPSDFTAKVSPTEGIRDQTGTRTIKMAVIEEKNTFKGLCTLTGQGCFTGHALIMVRTDKDESFRRVMTGYFESVQRSLAFSHGQWTYMLFALDREA